VAARARRLRSRLKGSHFGSMTVERLLACLFVAWLALTVLVQFRRVSKQLSLLLKPYEVEARASAPAMVSS